jgi:hypothetical protein
LAYSSTQGFELKNKMTKIDYQSCTNKGGGKVAQSWEHMIMENDQTKMLLKVNPQTGSKLTREAKERKRSCGPFDQHNHLQPATKRSKMYGSIAKSC